MARNSPETETPVALPPIGAFGTAAQFCALFQISRTTFWRLSNQPGFPAPARFGRAVRYNTAAVEAFLTKRGA